MLKWKLFITSLPYVVVVLAVKLALVEYFHIEGLLAFSEIALVLTGGIFLIGFMLAGTMADYKESEKIPAELAGTLETLEDTAILMAAVLPQHQDAPRKVRDLTESIFLFFTGRLKIDGVLARIVEMGELTTALEKAGSTGYALRFLNELSALRKLLLRVDVIKRTDFIAYGYALLEFLLGSICLLLLIAKFKDVLDTFVLTTFVSLIYIYMYRLIKDIDDPFEYDNEGQAKGSEVDLFPFLEYRARINARFGAQDGTR